MAILYMENSFAKMELKSIENAQWICESKSIQSRSILTPTFGSYF